MKGVPKENIPKHTKVNCLYFLHDIDFKHKKFIYRFAGSDDIKEITIDSSKKRKREDEIRDENTKQIAINMIYKGEDVDKISSYTGLTKDEIEELQYEILEEQDE